MTVTPTPTPTPMMTPEAIHALIERQARAWERADLDAIPADFAPDGWLISPGGRWQGPAAIRAAAAGFFAVARDVRVTITRVILHGETGAVEWTWSETRLPQGTRHTADDAVIFVLRGSQIIYWREYFDTAAMDRDSHAPHL
ncbi:MAG: nuclear transport factor 2 family protein [Anaerolineae bacterium]|nr:nuclear transport factor 2 family protein [Anaerolineae bacterium]